MNEDWFDRLQSLAEEHDTVVLSQREFEGELKSLVQHASSPLDAVTLQIQCEAPFESVSLGIGGQGEPTYVHTPDSADVEGSQFRISYWKRTQPRADNIDSVRANECLSRLLKAFWKPQLRDEKSRLPSLQIAKTYPLLDNSLARFLATADQGRDPDTLCVFFCDLDNFKDLVNDKYGERTGDQVILKLASIFQKTAGLDATALHRSGDEFIVLYQAARVEEALSLSQRLAHAVLNYDFELEGTRLGIAVGIATLEAGSEPVKWKELEDRAERAVKPRTRPKERGKTRLEDKAFQWVLPERNALTESLALCIAKTRLHSSAPFECPWLNFISSRIYEVVRPRMDWDPAEIQSIADEVLDWIQPDLRKTVLRTALPAGAPGDFTPLFSSLDVLVAVAHALFRAWPVTDDATPAIASLQINYDPNDASACQLQYLPGNITLVKLSLPPEAQEVWDLGRFVRIGNATSWDLGVSPQALLIKIGHSELNIPTSLFAEIMVLDDRPTRGGGLRDFWEATIAKLVACVESNENIVAVYVLGRHELGVETIAKLRGVSQWAEQAEMIAEKTGMSANSVRVAAERLQGRLFFPEDERGLVCNLAELLLKAQSLQQQQSLIAQSDSRFLHLEMNMEGLALGKHDGCRVRTIAEAFPVVLEIARKVDLEEIIVDQAGQRLSEIIDFKVHLTNPSQDIVPAFYRLEEESLARYFEREFLSDSGLFGRRFQETGQLEAVLKHVVHAVTDSPRQFCTRRAILVVPHEIEEGEDLTPLGLVSVRIIPRFLRQRIRLHFSYTWRTVEALVGFPYSIYGSVRFSQHLTEEIRGRMPAPDVAKLIEMGEVSYIAHSLHIFLDDYGQNIARRIISNAAI